MQHMFFESWDSLIRSFVITILAYVILIFLLRISGKSDLNVIASFNKKSMQTMKDISNYPQIKEKD